MELKGKTYASTVTQIDFVLVVGVVKKKRKSPQQGLRCSGWSIHSKRKKTVGMFTFIFHTFTLWRDSQYGGKCGPLNKKADIFKISQLRSLIRVFAIIYRGGVRYYCGEAHLKISLSCVRAECSWGKRRERETHTEGKLRGACQEKERKGCGLS